MKIEIFKEKNMALIDGIPYSGEYLASEIDSLLKLYLTILRGNLEFKEALLNQITNTFDMYYLILKELRNE